jgi:hypothetical protein
VDAQSRTLLSSNSGSKISKLPIRINLTLGGCHDCRFIAMLKCSGQEFDTPVGN